jgi:O-acetylhomoserine/O-acetylserine sulfhydrylase-like pyridoxal-dependent enzyme
MLAESFAIASILIEINFSGCLTVFDHPSPEDYEVMKATSRSVVRRCINSAMGGTALVAPLSPSGILSSTVARAAKVLNTFDLRFRQAEENAAKVAEFLEAHPMVTKVHFPGLKSHSDHELAKSMLKGGVGTKVSFVL